MYVGREREETLKIKPNDGFDVWEGKWLFPLFSVILLFVEL